MADNAKLTLDGKDYEFPVITGTEDEKAFDIGKLRAQTGYVTFDEGYKNTGATQSNITFLDGEKGILRYRGYSIEDLSSKASFVEVSYLLLYGELPTKTQLSDFEETLNQHTLVHENLMKVFEVFPTGSHPM